MPPKAFLSILKKFPGGACPPTPLAAWALRAQVTRPKGVYIRVTPVTTKATAVQNSTENPDQSHVHVICRNNSVHALPLGEVICMQHLMIYMQRCMCFIF